MLAALLLLTCGAVFASPAERAKKFHFVIDKGALPSALEQFSRQTGLQVITQLNVSESKTETVGPFIGHATADQALVALLKDSDLSYQWQDQYTITLFAIVVKPPRSEDNVQEVLVTGTRLRSIEDGPAPVRVYSRGRIDRFGVSSVSDFTRYLTQQPYSFSSGHLQSGAQFFQMRGLGFDTTLVLINGRRVPPSANSISLNAVDINSIPLTAVDRVEVMFDSASAIYGADAIGGVVNIIMKDKIDEPEVSLHYGQANGGGEQRRASVSIGTFNDRLKASLVLDYYEQGALMGDERDLWKNQDFRRFGGRDYRVSTTNPGNVYSLTGQPLPGLSSTRAAVPSRGGLTSADFLATDGATNLESSFRYWSVTHPAERGSAYGSTEYSIAEPITLFGEFLAVDGESTAFRPPPSVSHQVVPATNPFNPFDLPVAVDYSFVGMDPLTYTYATNLLRLVGGVRGKIGRWDWEFTGLDHREDGSSTARGGLDYPRVIAAINSLDPQAALNLFSDGPAASPELLDSLVGEPQIFSFSFSSYQYSGFARGPLFDIGDRSAELVVGGEWRKDEAGFFESGKRVDQGRDVGSLFSELRLPLLEQLSLKLAVRGDDYGRGDHIVNPQYGLTWRPAKDWLFRAAYGTSFRSPSLFELYTPMVQPSQPIADPLRGGEVSSVTLIVGGNPDLEVVTARSFTTGFVFTPSELPGLRIGGSYWRIVMDNRIMVPIYQELLKLDSPLTSRVVRDPASIQDVQAGWAGRLRSIDIRRVNYGDLDTSGIDLDLSVLLEDRSWGCLKFEWALTWVDEYLSRDMNQVLPLDRVGVANVQGTIPEWRTVGTLSWKHGQFGASTTTTYTPSYQDADLALGPLDRSISSQTVVDLQAWIDLKLPGSALLDGTKLTFGARNLFDKQPDFANAGVSLGYDYSQGELTRRFVYFRVSKHF